ncbi:MAG: hypothetical protein Q7R39_06210, partial [Dehalococcoidia bacterium]|nr:hypothetical protein [Dehalococcoidia bacterium]
MRSFLEDLSLKRRITLSVALGLAFILAVFGYMTMWAVQQSTDQIYHEREALARSTARYVDALMLRLQREVEDAASLASQVTTLRARSELIAAHRSDVFNRLLLANYHGDVTWQTPSDNPLANVSSWPCVQRSGLTFQPATTSLLVDTGGAPAGCIAYPLSDNSGMLVAELNLRSQEFGVLPADDGEQGLIIDVVDDGGAVLTSSHASTTWVDHMFVLGPLIDANLSGVRAHEMPGGSSRPSHLVAYAPLISVSQWGITVEQSQDIALALPGSLGWRIMLIGAIMLLLGSVVAGQLSAAFASMTRNLVRARDELVSRNQELSALSSIAATVGQSLELDEVMGKALQRVLEVTR